jgi:MFS family permease
MVDYIVHNNARRKTMDIARVIVGFASLFLGRQLFWLFVGAAGFIFGFNIARDFVSSENTILILVIAVLAGLVGAGLAVFLQQIAVAVAGFLGGGYVATLLLESLGVDAGQFEIIVYVLGGILGAILVIALFDIALIVLSSLLGSGLILEAMRDAERFNSTTQVIIFIALLVVGIAVQYALMRRYPPAEPRRFRVRRVKESG